MLLRLLRQCADGAAVWLPIQDFNGAAYADTLSQRIHVQKSALCCRLLVRACMRTGVLSAATYFLMLVLLAVLLLLCCCCCWCKLLVGLLVVLLMLMQVAGTVAGGAAGASAAKRMSADTRQCLD